jgi:uncharacterized coiled-coil DUF342 family protein
MNYDQLDNAFTQVSDERDKLREQVRELLAACKSMLGFVEMKSAHNGCMSVEQILDELKRVQSTVSTIQTGHHIGCSKTTRTVNLQSIREAIAKAEKHQ